MAFFGVRLDDDLAARFDALASANGGRSAALRALITRVSRDENMSDHPLPKREAAGRNRVEVRLNRAEMAALDVAARERGMKRADWVATLVRQRLQVTTLPPVDVRRSLVDTWRQLKRIGVNLNQSVRSLNAARMEGSRLDLDREAARVASFRDEIVEQLAKVQKAITGEGSYWQARP